jgi:transcriptional regulator with XRE-family HTH domain
MKDDSMRMAFGHEVRRRREGMGMTLETLSERSKLTPNYIGSVEIGKRDPSLTTVLALAKGLGVRPGELFASSEGMAPQTAEAAHYFDMAPPEVQKALMALLRTATKKHAGHVGHAAPAVAHSKAS